MSERTSRRRLGLTVGIACGAVLAFGVLGGTGLAGGSAKPEKPGKPAKTQDTTGQSQTEPSQATAGKVTICHKGKVTLRISVNALAVHQKRHDDTLGACAGGTAGAKIAKEKAEKDKAKSEKAKQSASGADDEDDDTAEQDDD